MANILDIYRQQAGLYDTPEQSTGPSDGALFIKQNRLDEAYAAKQKRLQAKKEGPDDADSAGNYWRLLGGDSPEVFHDIKPTGDAKNERSKVYKQVAALNGISIEEAVKQVDAEAEAYKADQAYRNSEQFKIDKVNALAINPNDAYYGATNLSDSVAEFRKRGMMKNNDGWFGTQKDGEFTSFDIYNAGDKAFQYAKDEASANPGTSLYDSDKFLTGDKGTFGRDLADNKAYVDRQIANGQMIPGADDTTEYNRQLISYNDAKKMGIGLFNKKSNVDPKVMEAIQDTSYSKWAEDNMMNGHYSGSNPVNQLWNAVKAVPASFLKSTLDMADGFGEITGLYDINNKKMERNVNNLFGYDDSFAQRSAARATAHFEKFYDDYKKTGELSWSEAAKGIFEFAKDPSQWGNSMGYMLSFLAGGGAVKAGLKFGVAGSKIAKATKSLQLIEKSEKYGAATKFALKTQVLAKSGAGNAATYLAAVETPILLAASHTINDQEKEFKKNNNGVGWSPMEKLQRFFYAAVMTKADVATDVSLASASKYGAKEIYDLMKKGSLGQALKGTAANTAEFALDASAEGGVEIGQNIQQVHAEQVGSNKYKGQGIVDRMSDRTNAVQALVAGAGGLGGAGQFKGARLSKLGVVEGAKKVLGKTEQKLNNKTDSAPNVKRWESVRGKDVKDYTNEDHYNKMDGEINGYYDKGTSSLNGIVNTMSAANKEGRNLTPEEITAAEKTVKRMTKIVHGSYEASLNHLSRQMQKAMDEGGPEDIAKVERAQQRLEAQANKLVIVNAVLNGAKKEATVSDKEAEKVAKEDGPITDDKAESILRSHFVPDEATVSSMLEKLGKESKDDSQAKIALRTRLQTQQYSQQKNDKEDVVKEKLFGTPDKLGLLDYENIMNSDKVDKETKDITRITGQKFLASQQNKIDAYKQAKDNVQKIIDSAKGNSEEANKAKKELVQWARNVETNNKNKEGDGYAIPGGAYFGFDNKEVNVYVRKTLEGYPSSFIVGGRGYTIGSIQGQINIMEAEQNLLNSKFSKLGIIGSDSKEDVAVVPETKQEPVISKNKEEAKTEKKEEEPTKKKIIGSATDAQKATIINRLYNAFKKNGNATSENKKSIIRKINKIAKGNENLQSLQKSTILKIKRIYDARQQKDASKNSQGETSFIKRTGKSRSRLNQAREEVKADEKRLSDIKEKLLSLGVDPERISSLEDRYAQLDKLIEEYADKYENANKSERAKLTRDINKEKKRIKKADVVMNEFNRIQSEMYESMRIQKEAIREIREKNISNDISKEEREIKKLDKQIKAIRNRIAKDKRAQADIAIGKHNKRIRELLNLFIEYANDELDAGTESLKDFFHSRKNTVKDIVSKETADEIKAKEPRISQFEQELSKRIEQRRKLKEEQAKKVNPGTILLTEDYEESGEKRSSFAKDTKKKVEDAAQFFKIRLSNPKIKKQIDKLDTESKQLLDDIINNNLQNQTCL